MAFKAYGVGGIKRDPNGGKATLPGDVSDYSARTRVTVDGVDFTPKRRVYQGIPSAEMLKCPTVMIQTLTGDPWPGSAADRMGVPAPSTAARVDANGDSIRLEGPGSMLQKQRDGLWPDEKERNAQRHAEAKFANPHEYAKRSYIAEGKTEAEAEKLAKLHGKRASIEIDDMLPASSAA